MNNALKEINDLLARERVFLVSAVVCFGNPPRHADPKQKFVLYVGHTAEEKEAFDAFMDRDYDPGYGCLLYTSPSPRDLSTSRMPSSA